MSKQEIIANVYYDKSGFGSKKTTLEDAKKKDKTITMQDVEEFFKNNIEEKRKQRGQNSFVAPNAYTPVATDDVIPEELKSYHNWRGGVARPWQL